MRTFFDPRKNRAADIVALDEDAFTRDNLASDPIEPGGPSMVPIRFPVHSQAGSRVALGDINGDGKLDIVITRLWKAGLGVLLNTSG